MRQYLALMRDILENGVDKGDRTGTGTRSLFRRDMRFDLRDGFPALTTKKLHLRSIFVELLWFIRGDTNIKFLKEHGVSIWDKWADENGDLGPIYGKQWRRWERADGTTVDQLAWVINELRTNPNSRRLIVNAWNAGEVDKMALPPCHMFYQFYTRPLPEGGLALDCCLYQRSCDYFLGVPFNIASYALLTMIIAQVVDMCPGEFIWSGGDVHLYSNHFEQAQRQLDRGPRPLPRMILRDPTVREIDDFRLDHFELTAYDPHPHIAAPVAV